MESELSRKPINLDSLQNSTLKFELLKITIALCFIIRENFYPPSCCIIGAKFEFAVCSSRSCDLFSLWNVHVSQGISRVG